MNCLKCKKPIPSGTPHFSILKNIETMSHDFNTGDNFVEVLDSVSLFELCGECGNKFDPEILVRLFKITPLNNTIARQN